MPPSSTFNLHINQWRLNLESSFFFKTFFQLLPQTSQNLVLPTLLTISCHVFTAITWTGTICKFSNLNKSIQGEEILITAHTHRNVYHIQDVIFCVASIGMQLMLLTSKRSAQTEHTRCTSEQHQQQAKCTIANHPVDVLA